MNNPNIGKYILVEATYRGEPDRLDNPVGLFSSTKAAKEYARSDADNIFLLDDNERGRIEDWGSPQYLCRVIQVFKPVPVVSVKMELSTVKEQKEE